MNVPLVDLKAQYASIREEIDGAIQRVVQSGQFILGPEVTAFEEEMAACCSTKYAVSVASGTDALHLALLACGIKPGDEVVTTPFTFIATAECIAKCGAKPVFADIDPKTYNIDPSQVESKVTDKTRAIVPVHLYGQPADMDRILDIARKHNLKVIEDCAQALGASYYSQQPTANSQQQSALSSEPNSINSMNSKNWRTVGSLGDAGCLSFFPSKVLGAYGDGGMVVTNNPEIAETVKTLRVHGSKTSYQHVMHGFNSRLDALQAAILSVKLKHLDRWNDLRRSKSALYTRLLSKTNDIEPPYFEKDRKPSCNYYTVRVKGSRPNRNELRNHLESRGIQTMVYYPLSLHLQEVYKYLGHKPGDFRESERAQEQVLTLPMYAELTEEQVERIAREIKEATGR